MSFRTVIRLSSLAALLAACGGAGRAPPPGADTCTVGCDPDAGPGGSGGSAGSSNAEHDAGGVGSSDATIPPASECGNGILEARETCDGEDFGEATCGTFGFSEGALSCVECVVSTESCSGVEVCTDGDDDDGDGGVDCADEDCAAACANACAIPTVLDDSVLTPGRIDGQAGEVTPSCGPEDSLAQVIFAYEAPLTGVAEIALIGASSALTLSARSTCEADGDELACNSPVEGVSQAQLRLEISAGETSYLVVAAPSLEQSFDFQLVAAAREIRCGDGFLDPGEECDDGNFVDADACDTACEFHPDEDEPNDAVVSANPYSAPGFFGAISSTDDDDIVSIAVTEGQRLAIQTFDLGDGACARLELDNLVELLDSSGASVAADDDGGIGFCAALLSEPLAAGTYYVRVSASGIAESFLYKLSISS